jgi:hypothetical protein
MKRAISQEFLESLQKGELSPILEIVIKDRTLDLEMRGNEIDIYYQGLKLLSITEKGNGIYEYGEMDKEYRRRKNGSEVSLPIFSLDDIDGYLSKAKHVIDTYNINEHFEYEVKQMIVRENNLKPNANDTDFFIIDTEYQNEDNNQFDIIALHLDSERAARRKAEASIAIIEIKQGNGSIKTTSQNPGIRRHLEDYYQHIADNQRKKAFINDMEEIFKQKFELGLIDKGLSDNTIKKLTIEEVIEFYIVLADYKTATSALKEELKTIEGECNFFQSSFMGYGLYNWAIKSKEEILKLL